MKRVRLDRRAFLRGAGGVMISLPFLEAMSGCAPQGDERAAARAARALSTTGPNGFPKRFIAMYTPNGVVPGKWKPTTTGPDYALSPWLMPLADHKADLLVISGTDMDVTYIGPGDAHQKGTGGALTGRPLLEGNFGGGNGTSAGFASGMSVDQKIASVVGVDTRFASLELGVQVPANATPLTRVSYKASNQPLPPESDPFAVFTRLFGNGSDPLALARLRAERQTVLSAVQENYRKVSATVSAADRQKLEQHVEAVREIERRLTAGTDPGPACVTPEPGAPIDLDAAGSVPAIGALQMDLLAMALACDLTRVATLQWSRSGSAMRYPWLGINDSHHLLSHAADTDTVAQTKLLNIGKWYMGQLAGLIARLKALPEGDGTVFDNTVILVFTELAKGNNHTRLGASFLVAGSCGAALRTGRHVSYGGAPHNNLLVSLMNAMGVEEDRFGHADFCTGPLGNLA